MAGIDAIILACYVIVFVYSRCKDSLIILFSFIASVLYTSSPYFDVHSAVINHTIVSACFIPSLFYLTKRPCIAVMLYVIFHWLVAGDYLFFPSTATMISQSFYYFITVINSIIILAMVTNHDHTRSRTGSIYMDVGWLPNLFSSKREGKA